MLAIHQMTLNGNLGEEWHHLAAKFNPVEKICFRIELETNREIWEVTAPEELSAQRLVQELVKRKPCLGNAVDWLLYDPDIDFLLEPTESLRENRIKPDQKLSLVFIFSSG